MIGGLNTAVISQAPPPYSFDGTHNYLADACGCYPRARSYDRTIIQNGIIVLYSNGDAASITSETIDLIAPDWVGNQPTPMDAQMRPFVNKGKAYLKIIGGRAGAKHTIDFTIVLTSGQTLVINLKLEIL